MKSYNLSDLSHDERGKLLLRPHSYDERVEATVRNILARVGTEGDNAVRDLTKYFDGVSLDNFRISKEVMKQAGEKVSVEVKEAVRAASENIRSFHHAQIPLPISVETMDGVICKRLWRPIQTVGLYIPGGTAPLISTVLMLGIPARLAGCDRIIICTPPTTTGSVSPEIVFAATEIGMKEIFSVGGAQAIASMAIGTASIPSVDKIFGPGNRYVVAAKSLVSQPPYNVAIDLMAGPSELLVLADESAEPVWIAADLLSQAEHGQGSQVVLLSTSSAFIECVKLECEKQMNNLPRKEHILKAWLESYSLIVPSIGDGIAFANDYAPEHLQLSVVRPERFIEHVRNAGSVFLGTSASVVFGDYASGTNHTLPTNFGARVTGGITVESFMKSVSFQTITPAGSLALRPIVETLARAEGLEAHARAAKCRENR